MEGLPRHGRALLLVLLAFATFLPSAAAQDRPAPRAPGAASENAQLLRQLDGARVYRDGETGRVGLIGAIPGRAIGRPTGLAADAPPESAARAHLAEYGPLFGLPEGTRGLRVESAQEAAGNRSVVRFQQAYEGVPVLGGELNVQVDGANGLLAAAGEVLPRVSLDTEPGVDAQEARGAALAKVARDRGVEPDRLIATEPELWIYDPALLGGPGPRVPRLVWRMDVAPAAPGDFRELVLVDAKTGVVALDFDQIDGARDRRTHTANSTRTLPGTPVCGESDPSCVGGDADAATAHRYAGETYDFYKDNHGRDGIDGAGMPLISTVHYGASYRNAFWDGRQMVYGDGFSAADDVVGHELTHGVTEHESGLFYYYQSGAINESFSDVWGEFLDLSNGSGTDTAAVRWKVGEDIPGVGAIRDMKDPTAFRDPDRMRSPYYAADVDERDAGGVHQNSGVNNKAAYLLTDGGTFNGRTVTGLGIAKTAKIYYEAQANLLTSASDYQNLYAALRQACVNLTGTAGITAADCGEVKDAVDATEMNLQPTTAPAPEAPVCAPGQTSTTLFSDDMENTAAGNWRLQTATGSNTWGYGNSYATSGGNSLYGSDQRSTADYSVVKADGVVPPAGKITYLRFAHSYGFDDSQGTYYDGGVLEYSTDGAPWTDAGSLIVDNGYGGTMSGAFGNPLGGRPGFVGESNGYVSSRVNLSPLAGKSVRFRFRIGTDSSVGDYGWFVDDVRVYTCNGGDTTAPAPPIINAPEGGRYDTDSNVTLSGTAEMMLLANSPRAAHTPLRSVQTLPFWR